MILFANGCSFTWGGSLEPYFTNEEDRLALCWPAQLGSLLGADEVVNLGEGCGSNQRILRTTFDWLAQQTPERLADTVAVIQWTDSARYEYYCPENFSNSQENIPERWAKVKEGICLQVGERHSVALDRSQRRLETLTLQEESYQIITNCSAIVNMFQTFGVTRYYFWSHHNYSSGYLDRPRSYFNNRFPWLDKSNRIVGGWKYDTVSESDKHPSVQGHKELAEIIYKNMN
jgi:hypothetical protein